MNRTDFLLSRIESAKELDFGSVFSQSIELFKKNLDSRASGASVKCGFDNSLLYHSIFASNRIGVIQSRIF